METTRATPIDALLVALARERDVVDSPAVPARLRRAVGRAVEGVELPPLTGLEGVDRLGACYEAQLPGARRRSAGAFFTPRGVADGLVAFALDGAMTPPTVCDPSAGAGAFLLAAGRHLERMGLTRAEIVRDWLWGADLDRHALAVAEAALFLWSAETGTPTSPGSHLVVGDALLGPELRDGAPADGFGLVVGNPPFQNQLGKPTARTSTDAARVRERFGRDIGPYTDTAALFLLAALDLAGAGGRVSLILPESFLSARDARGVRRHAVTVAALDGLWTADEPVFPAAAVDVLAPVFVVGGREGMVRRATGPSFEPSAPVDHDRVSGSARTWSSLVVRGSSVPAVALDDARTMRTFCETTAGFRDQYYGLVDMVFDEAVFDEAVFDEAVFDDVVLDDALSDAGGRLPVERYPLLVTSGLIDPAICRWGQRPARFARSSWHRPRVDLDRLRQSNPSLARWADERLVPKVVVATQTRVIEAAVDVAGAWYPSTPTIAVTCPPQRLWEAAAVLSAPPISAWALHRLAGGALARDAIKLAARDVLEIPLPTDAAAWREGARHLEEAVTRAVDGGGTPDLEAFGAAMCRAYGVDGEVLGWWRARLGPARVRQNA